MSCWAGFPSVASPVSHEEYIGVENDPSCDQCFLSFVHFLVCNTSVMLSCQGVDMADTVRKYILGVAPIYIKTITLIGMLRLAVFIMAQTPDRLASSLSLSYSYPMTEVPVAPEETHLENLSCRIMSCVNLPDMWGDCLE